MESNESTLFCSAERHLLLLGSATAIAIYGLAWRLSANTGRFNASTRTLAHYFRVRQQTVVDAIRLLVEQGWFEVLTADPGKSVVYCPVSHNEWEATHPEKCIEKLEYPWSGEEKDELGRMLFALTDRRFKIYPNLLKGLRNTGHSDGAIESHFTQFWQKDSRKKGIWGRFRQYLTEQPVRMVAA